MNRILFTATLFSPLAARWVAQLADTEWDVHVFGSQREVHPLFCADNITVHAIGDVKNPGGCRLKRYRDLWPLPKGRGRLRRHAPQVAHWLIPEEEHLLKTIIQTLRPDVVHSLKMQNESYLMRAALEDKTSSISPPWIYSAWGSDIYLHQHFPEHLPQIRGVLSCVDYLMVDNKRDFALAVEHGFQGEFLGVFPTGGGYPIGRMRKQGLAPTSMRTEIAVKGYQAEYGGQALTSLNAIKRCGPMFDGYKFVIHSAIGTYASSYLDDVRRLALEVSDICRVPIEFLPYSPPEAIWDLFSQSRIALAISNTDGTPNAMLEAMAVGAFPIQSDTGGLDDWIRSGQNGYLVPFDDVDAIAAALINTLRNDQLVDSAAESNLTLTEQRLNYETVRARVLAVYERLLQQSGHKSSLSAHA